METSTIIVIAATSFITLLPVLKHFAKKNNYVLDDKILTWLGMLAKKLVGKYGK